MLESRGCRPSLPSSHLEDAGFAHLYAVTQEEAGQEQGQTNSQGQGLDLQSPGDA